MTERTWAVVSDEGLTLFVNLTEAEARQTALERRTIVADFSEGGGLVWAVSMGLAADMQVRWTALGEQSAKRLRSERLRLVTEYLREE